MKLRKVISGGQTGVDRTALECAKQIGLETGGTAPKGWRTDEGPAPELGTEFGLVESTSSGYRERTYDNARDSDATVWFGRKSPGYWCTVQACKKHGKKFYDNPTGFDLTSIANDYEVLNFAGNRLRINPNASLECRGAFRTLADLTGKHPPN